MDGLDKYEEYNDYNYDFIRMTPAFQVSSAFGIGILILLAVIGNGLTIVAYIKDKRLNTVYDFYIFNLAVTDLLIGCISMPFYAKYTLNEFTWELGNIFCKVWLVIDFTLCLQSVLLILLLSMDRLLLISYGPYYATRVTKEKAGVQVAISWMIAFCIYGPSIIGWNHWVGYSTVEPTDCDVEFAYNFEFTTITSIVEFVIPIACLAILNSLIYYHIRSRLKINNSAGIKQVRENRVIDSVYNTDTSAVATCTKGDNSPTTKPSKITFDHNSTFGSDTVNIHMQRKTAKIKKQTQTQNKLNSRAKRDSKAARFLAILVIVFLICWAPYTITTLIISFCAEECVNTSVYESMNWLLWSKSAINPFLYAMNSSRYKYNFKKYLICWKTQIFPSNVETTLHTAA